MEVDFTAQSFWEKGGFGDMHNPWAGESNAAPFNREFYLILNVAVGGANGYFPDGVGGKPWSDGSGVAPNQFWDNRSQWTPTWSGDDVAMKIDSVKVWSLDGETQT